MRGTLLAVASLAAVLALGTLARAQDADFKCRQTINKEYAKYIKTKSKVLQKCNDAVVKGGTGASAPGGNVAACDPGAKIAAGEQKLRTKITKTCQDAGITPAAIGWPPACPDFEDAGCTTTITTSDDIATCLVCIANRAVCQAIDLYYLDLTDGGADKDLIKCQRTIGKETAKFLNAKLKILSKCRKAVDKGNGTLPCPAPGDGKAQAAIAKAESKKVKKICKACDTDSLDGLTCTGPDTFTPAAIGITACPSVIVPGGGPDCGAFSPIDDVTDLAKCVDCVTEFKVDCMDALSRPDQDGYPPECQPPAPTPTLTGPTPTGPTLSPTPSATATATATPTTTATPTPTVTPSPCVVDLDVDSDNTNNTPDFGPGRDAAEDVIEDDANKAGRYVGVNNDDDDNDGVVDFDDGHSGELNAQENDFVRMVVEVPAPFDLTAATVNVTSGVLRVWTKAGTVQRALLPMDTGDLLFGPRSAAQLGLTNANRTIDLWIEGTISDPTIASSRIVIEIDPDGDGPRGVECSDAVRVTVGEIDADVDSDNDNGVNDPGRTNAEDGREDRMGEITVPGKLVKVNDNNDDDDAVLDRDDGYDLDGVAGNADDQNAAENDFVPLILELRATPPFDLTIARIRVTYLAQPPGGAPAGQLRLWRKPGSAARNKNSARAATNPGDYVEPGIYDAAQLGLMGTTRVVTLYIEAIDVSLSAADNRILFELDPDGLGPVGPAGFIINEAVRVTSIAIRYILDNNDGDAIDDPSLRVLNVSNLVTTQNLGLGNGEVDPDNFKVEVESAAVVGNQIAAAEVTLEARDRNGLAFNPQRTLQAQLDRVAPTNRFRSAYLRLVTDAVDQAAVPAQTLLTSSELPMFPSTEILGQIVQATYRPQATDSFRQHATVGDQHAVTGTAADDHRGFSLAGHRLTDIPAGSNVTDASIQNRFHSFTRERYAQSNLRVRGRASSGIAPLQNYVSISHDHGRAAAGGAGSNITLQYRTTRGAVMVNYTVTHAPPANATPIQTANALIALVNAQNPIGHPAEAPNDFLTAQAFQNNAIFGVAMQSADIRITDPMGGTVTVTGVASTDAQQTIQAPPANNALIVWNNNNWLVGSIEQRALIRTYDSGTGTVDIFVAQTLTTQAGAGGGMNPRGAAMILGAARPAVEQAITPIVNNAFVDASCADNTANNPFVIAHEIGHCLLDAVHVANTTQVMDAGGTAVNPTVNQEKRFQDANIAFDSVGANAGGGNLNQVTTMRGSGMVTAD